MYTNIQQQESVLGSDCLFKLLILVLFASEETVLVGTVLGFLASREMQIWSKTSLSPMFDLALVLKKVTPFEEQN